LIVKHGCSALSHGQALKFRQFLLRGAIHVSGEWGPVCLAYNVKRMHRMQGI